MCGICGVLGPFNHREEQAQTIERMTAVLNHRGPDGHGIYIAPDVALGHTRLSIIDPAAGHQPMETERHVISFNGEIYNHRELRQDLLASGVTMNTRCDTEVLLRLFERDGTAAFGQLNGQFALLIWDRWERTLTVARDRLGIRPLYIMNWQDRTYFGSEMKAFDTLDGYRRCFAPQQLLEHAMLWNTLQDDTPFEGIQNLEAGTYRVFFPDGTTSQRRYHEIGDSALGADSLNYAQACERFEELLLDAVDLRLQADVPVGAYLSGGIDSTVIATLTHACQGDGMGTFSVSFHDQEFDESIYQREVSERIGSRHQEVKVARTNIAQEMLRTVYHAEQPFFRTAPVPMRMLSSEVRASDIRVVLTGEGADECLYGYDSFKEVEILHQWRANPSSNEAPELIKQLYPHLAHYADPKRFGMLKMYYEGFLDSIDDELGGLNIRVANNQALARYLNPAWDVDAGKERLRERLCEQLPGHFRDWTILQRQSYLELRTLLPGYLLSSQGDRMAMANGIEGRFPFLDHRVLDLAFNIRDEYKLKGFSQKHILRDMFRGRAPDSVLNRPKRPYMAPDLASFYVGGQLIPEAREFLSHQAIIDHGIFDPKMANRLVTKFERRMPGEIGYRDNMVFTFMLTAQMASHWARYPLSPVLDRSKQTVRIDDYSTIGETRHDNHATGMLA